MSDSYIEGIGNEVIYFFGTVVTVVAGAITWSCFLPHSAPQQDENIHRTVGRTYNSEICPICIGPHRLPVETNCGHKFCGPCIREYLNNRPSRDFLFLTGNMPCPMCRQSVTLLLYNFGATDAAVEPAERRAVEVTVNEFNIRYGSGPQSWTSYIRDCPVLVRHLLADFFSFSNLLWMFPLRVMTCFVVGIMYILSPLDIVPEAIFGFFGLLDDLLIVFLCAIYISIIYRRFVLSRANEADM